MHVVWWEVASGSRGGMFFKQIKLIILMLAKASSDARKVLRKEKRNET